MVVRHRESDRAVELGQLSGVGVSEDLLGDFAERADLLAEVVLVDNRPANIPFLGSELGLDRGQVRISRVQAVDQGRWVRARLDGVLQPPDPKPEFLASGLERRCIGLFQQRHAPRFHQTLDGPFPVVGSEQVCQPPVQARHQLIVTHVEVHRTPGMDIRAGKEVSGSLRSRKRTGAWMAMFVALCTVTSTRTVLPS